MPTWQLFSDGGNNVRWESRSNNFSIEQKSHPIEQPTSPPARLPSTSDLFLQTQSQGIAKPIENQNYRIETPPTFRTGLPKSFSVKQSSVVKALPVIDDDFADIGQSCQKRDNGGSFPISMFQTGSGKAVTISSLGLVRAKTLLGLGENDDAGDFNGFVKTENQCNTSESFQPNSSHLRLSNNGSTTGFEDATSVPVSPFQITSGLLGVESKEATPEGSHSVPIPPPSMFQTARGRSISVSGDALQRARGLLGDPELGTFFNEVDAGKPLFPNTTGMRPNHNYLKKEAGLDAYFSHGAAKVKQTKNFISPVRTSNEKKCAVRLETIGVASNLIKIFDAEEHESTSKLYTDMPSVRTPLRRDSLENGSGSRLNLGRSSGGPLVDLSNTIGTVRYGQQSMVEKRKLASRISVSPFKRPRTSKFVPPMNRNSSIPNGLPSVTPQDPYCEKTISTHYQHQARRKYVKEYFGVPPCSQYMLESLPDWVRRMNPENAEKYDFGDQPRSDPIGVDTLYLMLVQSGSSPKYISKEWMANHYKWIVWKLACYERSYPARFSGKLLTFFNVLEELKYRYDREVNHSHRSALKKILEGDAPPSSMMVLCISSIPPICGAEIEALCTSSGAGKSKVTKIELTDGWYSVNAILDEFLSMKLATGKLFVGQKLRICGARLCDWVGPVSPLEASRTITLCLHINGTYRAHWADRLGFCKGSFVPLAFRCIKGGGGAVPCTLVGVTRVYPVLYKERLHDGGSAIRSERTETKIMQLYDQRRSDLVEGITSEFQRGLKSFQTHSEQTIDEMEELYRILETADEPDIIMADMSIEQLNAFASYQSKREAKMQSDLQELIEKALKDAGLSGRDVTPFMKVRVVGLTSKSNVRQHCQREGIITIWNLTEKQQSELVEGQTYSVAGLLPISSESNTVHLQARSNTKWWPLSPSTTEHFHQFFNPRKPILISNMGDVPLHSEFDIAAFVIYVGPVYKTVHQKTQWVFVTDGSNPELGPDNSLSGLLAIKFFSPSLDCDSITPINYNLAGSTVGFCNLIKREKDTTYNNWVAETNQNSTYFLSYDNKNSAHLKDVATASNKWARASRSTIAKLENRVSIIVRGR